MKNFEANKLQQIDSEYESEYDSQEEYESEEESITKESDKILNQKE